MTTVPIRWDQTAAPPREWVYTYKKSLIIQAFEHKILNRGFLVDRRSCFIYLLNWASSKQGGEFWRDIHHSALRDEI